MLVGQEIKCTDGHPISISCYEASEPKGLVIIGGALGVSQKYYRNFANFLVDKGYQAITFDYRGTGKSIIKESLSGINLKDWGAKDIEAIIETSKTKKVPIHLD